MNGLTARELDTVLAALRWYQKFHPATIPQEIDDIATNCGAHRALRPREIDDLCEKLNRA